MERPVAFDRQPEPAKTMPASNPFSEIPTQHLLVTGGTGFIGSALIAQLLTAGHQVVVLTRNPARANARWGGKVRCFDDLNALLANPALTPIDGVINLAGAPVVGLPWSQARQRVLLASRVGTTQRVIEAFAQASRSDPQFKGPPVWIQASAIGFYGVREPAERLTESSLPGSGFMSALCREWEAAALPAALAGARQVVLRLGVVWGKGGALPPLLMPIRLGLGGRVGSGAQIVSWIHLQDVLRLIARALAHGLAGDLSAPPMQGTYNAVAPEPISQAQFVAMAAKVLHRPNWLPLPAAPMRWALGEMAQIFVDGQHVVPERLLAEGFRFDFPEAAGALRDLAG